MNEPVFARETTQTRSVVNSFIQSVYNWMTVGLALTGIIAFYVASQPAILSVVLRLFIPLIIAELGLVFYLSFKIAKMEAKTATAMFVIYAMLNGLTMSVIFLAFAKATIASAFFITAATFGTCSIYGMVTKRDLTGMGQFMMMGFIGLFIAMIVNFFFHHSGLTMIINYLGVFIFVGLTAYDTQKLKNMALTQPQGLDAGVVRKGAIMGALTLYLDFILMFQFLLNILGGGRD